jgi:hypothetical protein
VHACGCGCGCPQGAWDCALRQIPAYPELFQTRYVAPDLGAYHYVLGLLVTLHFVRRFLEVLFLHKYSADMAWKTVYTQAMQQVMDVAFLDYHILQTERDLAGEGLNVFVYAGATIWLTGQMGSMQHHWLLRELRPNQRININTQHEKDFSSAASLPASGLADPKAQPTRTPVVLGSNSGSAKKKAKTLTKRAKTDRAVLAPSATANTDECTTKFAGYSCPASCGGMFGSVACPHYTYEVCTWVGVAVICRHIYGWALAAQVRMAGNRLE